MQTSHSHRHASCTHRAQCLTWTFGLRMRQGRDERRNIVRRDAFEVPYWLSGAPSLVPIEVDSVRGDRVCGQSPFYDQVIEVSRNDALNQHC